MSQPRAIPEVNERLDPRPAAAYLLGGHSKMVADRLEACQRWPTDYLGLRPSLVVLLNEIHQAVNELRTDVDEQVWQAIQKTLEALKYFVAEEFSYQAGLEQWAILRSEADRAFPSSHELFPLYDLGCVVGEYHLKTSQQDPNHPLPTLDALIKKAQRVLDKYRASLPVLRSLVELRSDPPAQPNWVLHQFLIQNSALPDLNFSDVGTITFNTGGDDSFISKLMERFREISSRREEPTEPMSTQITRLHRMIHHELAALRVQPSRAKKTLYWNKERSVLAYDGREICRYEHQAYRQEHLLQCFQEAAWAQTIENPFDDPDILDDTITALNRKLAPHPIRFHRHAAGQRVRWEGME